MTQKGPLTKYWIFRISNPKENMIPGTWPALEYVVWQKEKGEGGLIHLQGYVVFNQKKRLTWLKKVDAGAHWEPRKGTHAQARDYAQKEETRLEGPWSVGEEPVDQQGKRNDLISLKRRLDEGATEKEICEDEGTFPAWAKYHKIIPKYRMLTGKQRSWPTETVVYWGEPGIGKSSRAFHEGGADAFWLSKPAGQTAWWDGYTGQETVVIDEFYGWIQRDLMCRICDRYPLNVETKGGSQPFLAKKIIITSNSHPTEWWPKVGLGPMLRRLTAPMGKVVQMTTAWAPPAAPSQGLLRADESLGEESVVSELPGSPHAAEWQLFPEPYIQVNNLFDEGE